MKQYLDLLHFILRHGIPKQDRTKIGTLSIFGYQMRINLKNGFPLLTTKHCHFKSIVYELLWFLSGNTNISYLKKHKISIWNHWADKKGDLGPIYGKQWRYWKTYNNSTIDQILTAVNQLKNTPESRRILISAWNVGDLKFMSLPPCHILFQFYVVNQTLSCQVYQRSCDIFLGLPFNLASYALLTHMFAQQCELQVGELIWTGGDVHLYMIVPENISDALLIDSYNVGCAWIVKAISSASQPISIAKLISPRILLFHYDTQKQLLFQEHSMEILRIHMVNYFLLLLFL
uniref:Thymidylate synthase n=1 Tax=Glossina palpalis gambiensis TaxID=67801 RepID=A0A1B0C149_9MUSC